MKKSMRNYTKVCLVCSCGGHFMEMMQLVPFIEEYEYYIVTECHHAFDTLLNERHYYYLKQQKRKGFFSVFTILSNLLLSLFFLLKERPTTIVSTGAGSAIPTCVIGKLMGARLIFIESFAKVEHTSMTGRILYRFADYFFVQWESGITAYPKAKYAGALY